MRDAQVAWAIDRTLNRSCFAPSMEGRSNWFTRIRRQLAKPISQADGLSKIRTALWGGAVQANVSKETDLVGKILAEGPRASMRPWEAASEFIRVAMFVHGRHSLLREPPFAGRLAPR